jgi:Tfp pilus assembly protein PilX
MTATQRARVRLTAEDGTALIIALMSMMLLTALAAAVVMVGTTETRISRNYRDSQEALYAADAAVERVVQDLLLIPRWNDILSGTSQSGFVDGTMTSLKTLPGGTSITLCCAATTATGQLQAETDTLNQCVANIQQLMLLAW